MKIKIGIPRVSAFLLLINLFLPTFLWAGMDLERYNREIRPKEYKRIVSLAPSLTEILFALGLGDRIIGVTKHCDFPAEARKKISVGSYIDLNIEKILSLKPDLVIATADGNEKGSVERLAAFHIPVLVTNPRSLDETLETIRVIGRATQTEKKAEPLVHSLKKRADRIIQACRSFPRVRVFLQINEHPLITVGKDTFHNHLIRLAGGVNISGEDVIKYPKYSLEQVLRSQPEVILITSMERGMAAERKKERWKQWRQLDAVRQERIQIIDSDLLDRPSPRLIDGLEALARAIHPEYENRLSKREGP
ncbi:MAG: cobalamin-binding protein [Thermodesulfobacteriota bacterium]